MPVVSKLMGSTRLHNAGRGLIYRVVKVRPQGRWPYEHRHRVELVIGRPLLRNEHVHHKNGDTLDNRIENLCIMLASDHHRHHATPDGWSKNHKCCVECGTIVRKHEGRGLCTACFQMQPKVKQWRRGYLAAKRLENRHASC